MVVFIRECGSTLYVGLQPIQTSSRYFSRLKQVCHTQTLTSMDHHISSLHSHFWVQLSSGSAFPQPDNTQKFLRFIIIRECGRTLYVRLARAVSPINTNFRLKCLLTRLQETLYEDLPVYSIEFEVYHHFCGLSFIAEVNFWCPRKKVVSCDLFIIRECGSTLYLGLECAVSSTNTNYRLTFLLTRLQEAPYEDLPV